MTEDVMSGIDQYTTKKLVPAFGDPELGIAVTRLVLTRSQSEVASHLSAFRKTCRIVKRQDERQRGQGPYTGDLLQQLCLGIFGLNQMFDVLIVNRYRNWSSNGICLAARTGKQSALAA